MNKALRFVWLSLLTLICGVASAGTVVFDPTVDTGGGKSITKNGITLAITSGTSTLTPTVVEGKTCFEIKGRHKISTDGVTAGNILSVTFEYVGNSFFNSYDAVTFSKPADGVAVFTANDQTNGLLSVTNGSASYYTYITKITVEYIGEDTPDDGSITIAKLLSGAKDVEAAKIRFTNAQVVYKEDNAGSYNYIVREDGKAIDLMNTSLSFDLGATLNGTVVMDVAYNGGIMLTTDIAETNSSDLTATGSSIDYLPITTTLNNLSNNKGDLVMLEKVEIYDDTNGDFGLGSVHLLKSGYTYALISNYDEIADQITDANGQYFVTAWYNGVQGAIASVKVVAVQQALAAPVITAAEPTFTESTTVTITAADGADIYYTTDGTTPTVGGATTLVYTVPFTINKTTIVKAIAVKDGVSSDVSENTFVGPKTIADIYATAANQENVLLYLNNAQVVYAKDNNYILREDGKALDILNSSLALTQGKSYAGNLKLKVAYVDGILTASDIEGETNADNLTSTGEESAEPLPIACDITQAKNYLGDLVTLSNVQFNLDATSGDRFNYYSWYDYTYYNVYISNAADFGLKSSRSYTATLWLDGVKVGDPSGKIIDAYPSQLDAPTINGEEAFASSVQVEIVSDEAAAEIYYTTDSTDPTKESTRYTVPFTITDNCTVKAIATYRNVVSSIAVKAFTKYDPYAEKTIADLADAKVNVPMVTVRLEKAKVVYGEDKSYILRENINGKDYALDVLNTELPLAVGATVSGTVMLKIGFKPNVGHSNGVLSTSDVAETNVGNLTIVPGANTLPDPIVLDASNFSNVYNYPGDILDLSGVYGWNYVSYRQLWIGSVEVNLTNGEDYGISNNDVYDNMLIWYNDVYTDQTRPLAKIVGKKENYDYTLTAAGWGTIIIPFDCEKPEGLTVYECTSVNEGKLVVEEVNSFKANTPYLLKGPKDVDTTYPLEGYAAKHEDKYEKGVMVGVYSWQEPPADSYVLQNQDEGLAFYRHLAGNGVEVGPNRCYIKPQSGELKSIQFPDDETNGVAYANATDSTLVDVYTTAGVKVKHQVEMGKALNDLPAGLYIINNKKIVKK